MSNIYFMCENCGIETNGITFVNGMKFCAKCYHQIFGKDNQQTEITQLKQQLAEKDKEIKKLNWQLKDKDFIIKNLNHSLSVAPNANAGQRARIDELTKIVKEKDKEIERLKTKQKLTFMHSKEDYFQRCNLLEEANIKLQFTQTQLAIQELEKVKELAVRLLDGFCHSINYSKKEFRGHRYVDFYDLIRGIDYQITELGGNQITELGGFEK